MATYYIYHDTPIKTERDKEGNVIRVVKAKAGDKVTQKGLGLSNEDWKGLIKRGVIRDRPIPKDLRSGESLQTYATRKQIRKMEEIQEGLIDLDDEEGIAVALDDTTTEDEPEEVTAEEVDESATS